MKKSLVLAMAMALGVTASAYAANPFSDVPAGHWAYDSISKLAAAGVIEGYGDDTFRGDRLMTRYEMAQIVAKAMAKGANVDKLAAEFADELDALGVRVAALEKKSDNVKITGQVRWSYEHHKYDDAYAKKVYKSAADKAAKKDPTLTKKANRNRLRTRLWFAGKVNDNWTYRARIENTQEFHRTETPWVDNAGDETTSLNRAYLDGRLGGAFIEAGRTALWAGDGNIYDDALDGIIVKYGKKIRVGAYYGKPTGHNDSWGYVEMDKAYGANLGFDFGKNVKLDIAYDKFDVKGDGDGVDIWNANLYGKFADKLGLGFLYMHTNSDNEAIIEKDASKNGFVVTADIAGAKFNKAGSWGIQAKYYHAPAGSAVSHTMTGRAGDMFAEGYKGYSIGANYTIAKNMMLGLTWYDLKGRQTKEKARTLWSEFQLRF